MPEPPVIVASISIDANTGDILQDASCHVNHQSICMQASVSLLPNITMLCVLRCADRRGNETVA
jgi:hypothetical protein